MKTGRSTLGFAYLRLSNEEAHGGESSSINDRCMIVGNYCRQNGITFVRGFVDDGWSGGNFVDVKFFREHKQITGACPWPYGHGQALFLYPLEILRSRLSKPAIVR